MFEEEAQAQELTQAQKQAQELTVKQVDTIGASKAAAASLSSK